MQGATSVEKTKIGIIGCGNISGIYFKNLTAFQLTEIVACADLVTERAEARAKEFNIPKVCTVDEMLADGQIQIVLNLTIPKAHAEVALRAVKAGKHVYNEKPLTISREDGRELLRLAEKKNVLVGCAPDTFLGGGIQTCRKLIDDGAIGEPVAAAAFMLCHGHESWHPDPEFYYEVGGGPMFDMGPYYLTALVCLAGPIARVTGSTRVTFPQRTITSQKKKGKVIDVEVPTHIAGVMDFECGAIGTIITSFDVYGHNLPRIEIYGSEGTLSAPDPNSFGGPVRIKRNGGNWEDVPLTHGYAENARGVGVADMACAIRSGRAHRANGRMAYHVLDVMHAFHDSSYKGKHIVPESACDQPAPLPAGLAPGTLDE
jgi:predicted dehydrogenase